MKIKEQERQQRQLQVKEAYEAQKKRTDAIVADMTRQYKSTDEELREHQARLEQRIDINKDEIEQLERKKQDIIAEKQRVQQKKEDEIKELNRYIDQMHQNFSQMLKTTLNKMKDRIDKANKQWENENDTNLIQKFKEIVDNGQDKQ